LETIKECLLLLANGKIERQETEENAMIATLRKQYPRIYAKQNQKK
jgi:hypothetical protein